jgi:Protein of unknown function (DUF2786)
LIPGVEAHDVQPLRARLLAEIRKLLRLAHDQGATGAEASAALERANALLIRHTLTLDHVAVAGGEPPAVTEEQVRTGWAGSWRGTLLAIVARHNLSWPG